MGGAIEGAFGGSYQSGTSSECEQLLSSFTSIKNKKAITHKYEYAHQANQHNVFIEEFFSGPDVKIYFDGQERLEISHLTYSLQEQLKPIYGYASRLYDEVAIGSRIVMGSFTIPLYNYHGNNLESLKPSLNEPYSTNQVNAYRRPAWVEQTKTYDQNHGTSRQSMTRNQEKYGKIEEGKTSSSSASFSRQLVRLGYLKSTETSSLAYQRAFQKYKKDNGYRTDQEATQALAKTVQKTNTPTTYSSRTTRETVKNNELDTFFSTNNHEIWRRNGYSIFIEVGDQEQYLRAILDIRLRSKSFAVDASGNPVAEVYEFIARDLRENTELGDVLI